MAIDVIESPTSDAAAVVNIGTTRTAVVPSGPRQGAVEPEEVFRQEVLEWHALPALPKPVLTEPEEIFARTRGRR
ncbi:hypothetical protein [Microbispora triticiradicis]|uniref:hypothetical protein n=1 Tax=Microbispora TaxID=2005 RepID=UPI00142EB676|nr:MULTISPECIES: hypothetical protein [Microbispora]